MNAHEILTRHKTFAIVGVSRDKEKYGFETFETLKNAGYKVFPINPKYESIEGEKCYSSLKELPERPEVVVTVVPPTVTEKVVEACAELKIPIVWMPPGSWSDLAIKKCQDSRIIEIHDVCIVFAVKSLLESMK